MYFDDGLLENFAETFYGYGDYNGPYWFIGMEEGGGDSFWIYAQHSRLPQLKNRKEYKKHYIPIRVQHIRERIKQYRPQVVVFYSTTYLKWWKQIADVLFSFDQASETHMERQDGTLFIVTDYPAKQGRGYGYFHKIGQQIASELASSHK